MKRKNDYYEKIEVEESKKENNRATHTTIHSVIIGYHNIIKLP